VGEKNPPTEKYILLKTAEKTGAHTTEKSVKLLRLYLLHCLRS